MNVVVQLTRPEELTAWEPQHECLIACEIGGRFVPGTRPSGGLGPVEIWEQRTYRCYRHGAEWRVDFGEGAHEPRMSIIREDWAAVVGWFECMRPRAIEVLID